MTIKKLKMKTKAIDRQLDSRVFWAVSGTFGLLFLTYLFFISSIVFNVVDRKTAEAEMRTLSSDISEMEIEYIALAKDIDLNMAKTLGFNEPDNVYFAARSPVVGAVSKSSDEL